MWQRRLLQLRFLNCNKKCDGIANLVAQPEMGQGIALSNPVVTRNLQLSKGFSARQA